MRERRSSGFGCMAVEAKTTMFLVVREEQGVIDSFNRAAVALVAWNIEQEGLQAWQTHSM